MGEVRYSVGIIEPEDGVPRVGLHIVQGDFTFSTSFDSFADAILIGHKLVEAGREVKALMDPPEGPVQTTIPEEEASREFWKHHPHKFVGRPDRDCEYCGRPDRSYIHHMEGRTPG